MTSLFGSFLICSSIGLVVGRYDNPFTIAEMLKDKMKDHIDPAFYAYLIWNIIFYYLAMIW